DANCWFSRQETEYFRRLTDRSIYYIGHPVSSSFIGKLNYHSQRRFFFFGSNNPVNEQSLRCIERMAHALGDEAEFLVGGGITALVASETRPSNLHTINFATDLSSFFQDGWISVNPVFTGTGNKIKTIDSLRYGAPVVSGRAGFDGVDTDEPMHQLPDEASFLRALKK